MDLDTKSQGARIFQKQLSQFVILQAIKKLTGRFATVEKDVHEYVT